jgi:2,4'-dihydroxyacetophenone dioxygenase
VKLADEKTLEWEEPPRGYYLTNVKQKVLWEDEKTGAMVALVRFPVGVADKVHAHPEANQFFYGLSGEIEQGDGSKAPIEGVFIHFSKGEKHGATKFSEEATVLFYWDGPTKPQIDE